MTALSPTNLLLIQAADDGELTYHNLTSVVAYLFAYQGSRVDRGTCGRIGQLIGAGYLSMGGLVSEPCSLVITGGGRLALLTADSQ